jgi:hypothetical protein
MRSSSIKSLTAVTTLALTLTLAVPSAEAKPSRSRDRSNRSAITTITQLIQKYFRFSATGELPGDPIPVVQPIAPPDPGVTATEVGALEGTRRSARK